MAALADPLHHRTEHEDPGGLDETRPEREAGEQRRPDTNPGEDPDHLPGLSVLSGDVGGRFLHPLLSLLS